MPLGSSPSTFGTLGGDPGDNAALAAALAAIAIPRTVFVSASIGNNATAEVGNPAKPYATAQAAFNAWVALSAPGRLHVMDGSVGGISLTTDMSYVLHITGSGPWCNLGGVTSIGEVGLTGEEDSTGGDGSPGHTIDIASDHSVNLGAIVGAGGAGGQGGFGASLGTTGGNGGMAPNVRLRWVLCDSLAINGGTGGDGVAFEGGGDTAGNGGDMGNFHITDLICLGEFVSSPGGPGAGITPGGNGNPSDGCYVRCAHAHSAIALTGLGGGSQVIFSTAPYLDISAASGIANSSTAAVPAWP